MPVKSPPFLMWYDDNPRLSITHKIEDAIEAYAGRLGIRPTLVLVNEEELTEFPGVEVRGVSTVRRNTYWVGQGDRPNGPPAAEASAPPEKPALATRRRKTRSSA